MDDECQTRCGEYSHLCGCFFVPLFDTVIVLKAQPGDLINIL